MDSQELAPFDIFDTDSNPRLTPVALVSASFYFLFQHFSCAFCIYHFVCYTIFFVFFLVFYVYVHIEMYVYIYILVYTGVYAHTYIHLFIVDTITRCLCKYVYISYL